jgi:hypothetical protein
MAMKKRITLVVGALLFSQAAHAVITFTELAADMFVVSHRIKAIGSRGKAMKLVYEKAASLCVAAGFEHYKILEQESNAGQRYDSANASIRVQFYFEGGEGRVECQKNSSVEYVRQAREKLAKRGYVAPKKAALDEATAGEPKSSACTVEQITAMVRAGLSDAQVKAACPEDE